MGGGHEITRTDVRRSEAKEINFAVELVRDGSELVARCKGELDSSSAARLLVIKDRITEDLTRVLLDCTELSFVDSFGINTVLDVSARCRDRNVPLAIEPSRQMRRVLEILGLGTHLGMR